MTKYAVKRLAVVCVFGVAMSSAVSIARADDVADAAAVAAQRLAEANRKKTETFLAWMLEQKSLKGSQSSIRALFDLVFTEDQAQAVVDVAKRAEPGAHRNLLWHAVAYTKSRAGETFLNGKLNNGTPDERKLAADCLAALTLRKMGVQCDLDSAGWVVRTFYPGRETPYSADDLKHLRQFPRLKGLSVGNVTDGGFDVLDGVETLEFVSLRIESPAIDRALASMRASKKLNVLNLHGPVTDAGLAHLAGLAELGCLRVNHSKVTDAGMVHLKDLKKLAILELEDTQVTDAGLVHLEGLTGVKHLNLAGTRITDDGLVHLRNMKQLWALHLGRTAVGDLGLEQFREFDALKGVNFLYIEQTNVTDAGLAHLTGMQSLKGLHANRNKLTDEALQHMAVHNNLAWINASRTAITENAARQFARGQSTSFYLTYGTTTRVHHAKGGPPKLDPELDEIFRVLERTNDRGRVAEKDLQHLADQGPNLIEPLLESVKKGQSGYQNAARVLVRMGPAAQPRLLAALRKDEHYMTRQTIAWAFREMGVKVMPLMIDLLGDQSPQVRHMASDNLYHLISQAGSELPDGLEAKVITALSDKHAKVRRNAAGMLSRFGNDSGKVVPALLKSLQTDKDLNVRIYCVASLGRIGSKLDKGHADQQRTLKALTESCLNDQSSYVRDVSVYYLGQLAKKDKSAVVPIVKATGDEDRNVRAKAKQVLDGLGVVY